MPVTTEGGHAEAQAQVVVDLQGRRGGVRFIPKDWYFGPPADFNGDGLHDLVAGPFLPAEGSEREDASLLIWFGPLGTSLSMDDYDASVAIASDGVAPDHNVYWFHDDVDGDGLTDLFIAAEHAAVKADFNRVLAFSGRTLSGLD